MTECETFKRLARQTWDLLNRGRTVGLQLGEEGLTDRNLLKIKISHPQTIYIYKYSKSEEGIEGADWEWWFLSSSDECIGFRVQAKVLNIFTQRYEYLHRSKKNPDTQVVTYQCDTLIHRASIAPYRPIPIYCLYSSWRRIRSKDFWPCGCIDYKRRLWGCSTVPAQIVKHLRHQENRKGINDLLPFLQPWHCLVCCKAYGGNTLPDRVCHYWNSIMAKAKMAAESIAPLEDIKWPAVIEPLKSPPNHVSGIIAGKPLDEAPDNMLAGVFIIKEGNDISDTKECFDRTDGK